MIDFFLFDLYLILLFVVRSLLGILCQHWGFHSFDSVYQRGSLRSSPNPASFLRFPFVLSPFPPTTVVMCAIKCESDVVALQSVCSTADAALSPTEPTFRGFPLVAVECL